MVQMSPPGILLLPTSQDDHPNELTIEITSRKNRMLCLESLDGRSTYRSHCSLFRQMA